MLFWVAIILVGLVISEIWGMKREKRETVDFSYFYGLLKEGKVKSLVVVEQEIEGELNERVRIDPEKDEFKLFKTRIPYPDPDLIREILSDSSVVVSSKSPSNFWQYILPWIPIVVIFVAWIFIWRYMMDSQGSGKAFSFAKSRAKRFIATKNKVTFKDVAGGDEAKDELKEVIEFLKDPKKFTRLGAKVPKGVLLIGAPGTGKTLLARAVAGEADVPFFSITGSDFVEIFVGVGASRVRDLFKNAKENTPCIIFIDEIDAVGRHRGNTLSGAHEEREQTLNALLSEMDGFEQNQGIIVVAATNRPEILDNALLRPGRFDRRVIVDVPDVKGRKGILEVHTRDLPLSPDVDLSVIAKQSPGFVGADLANMANEAALQAAKKGKDYIEMVDFEWAKDKILMGVERKSLLINEKEKVITANHEAGHAIVAKFTPESDPIHKVSIIPRGRALGVTQSLPIDDKRIYRKKYIESILCQLLGGRAAEMMVFGEPTSGAANDLERASLIARTLVVEWGMSDKVGPVNYGKSDERFSIGGKEFSYGKEYSEVTAEIIDQEVKKILEISYEKAVKILKDNLEVFEKTVKKLLEKEVVTGAEIDEIIKECGKTPLSEDSE
ncbi:ATP-dependent zinc metalloprotease FtsH [candidate division WOR-3 bacterium]|nr:ATP-dependent zinc metalloprotease FtsH [candidate division WOR-3 bacterium]